MNKPAKQDTTGTHGIYLSDVILTDTTNSTVSYICSGHGSTPSTQVFVNFYNTCKFSGGFYVNYGQSGIGSNFIGVTTKQSLSVGDYSFDNSNMSKLTVSVSGDGYIILTINNNTSSDFTFNTIQVGGTFMDSSNNTKRFLLAELDVGTITLAPSESKTFSIRKENLAQ